ncbi:hypothetical protein ADJ73_16290 [Arsenicicoccus sp. oral taxon 190]|nr:hypothetical protein ADJ73_16290 [Arsenicicoccus sp. oral taxon 190]
MLAGALASATALPAAAVLGAAAPAVGAPGPAPSPAPTSTVTKAPCPGTLMPPPPSPAGSRPPKGSPTPAPTATTAPGPAPRYPAPAVSAGDHPVGGDQLGSNGLVLSVPAGVPRPPELDATSYVLADQASGQVLVAKAPHARLYPASTLKTLTALTLLPDLDPHRVITATTADQAAEGTRVGMVAGNPYRTDQLWGALLLFSANDAAYALARSGPGGLAGTLQRMNATAAELGAHDTVAVDPSGLDAPGQRSSAYDLAAIGRAAMRRPDFRAYVATREITFPGARQPDGTVVAPYPVSNLNHFFTHYPGATGVKTGFTTGAHRTFIGSATRGGRSYVVSFMCSDTVSWQQVAGLMDWAFAHGSQATPVGTLEAGAGASASASPSPSSSAATPGATAAPPPSSWPTPTSPALQGTASPGPLQRWWGAGVLTAVLLGAGALVTRRLSRQERRPRRRD